MPEEVDVEGGHQESIGLLSPQVQKLLVALEAAFQEPPLPPVRQADLEQKSCIKAVLQVPVRSAIAGFEGLLGSQATVATLPCHQSTTIAFGHRSAFDISTARNGFLPTRFRRAGVCAAAIVLPILEAHPNSRRVTCQGKGLQQKLASYRKACCRAAAAVKSYVLLSICCLAALQSNADDGCSNALTPGGW